MKKILLLLMAMTVSQTAFAGKVEAPTSEVETYYYYTQQFDDTFFLSGNGFMGYAEYKDEKMTLNDYAYINGLHSNFIKIGNYFVAASSADGITVVQQDNLKNNTTTKLTGNVTDIVKISETKFAIAYLYEREGYLAIYSFNNGQFKELNSFKLENGPILDMVYQDDLLYATGAVGFGSYLANYRIKNNKLEEISFLKANSRIEDLCFNGNNIYTANTKAGIGFYEIGKNYTIKNVGNYPKYSKVRKIASIDNTILIFDDLKGLVLLELKNGRAIYKKRKKYRGLINKIIVVDNEYTLVTAKNGLESPF